jgi:SAM-dependent methyltransferase
MSRNTEAARLEKVYRDYRARGLDDSKWSETNPGNRAIASERTTAVLSALQRAHFTPLRQQTILEIGCGIGNVLAEFQSWGAAAANLYGIDVLPEAIQEAQQTHPEIQVQTASGECVPFRDGFFDLVVHFTVFSSILSDAVAGNVAAETARVLRSGGAVLWYDFRINNPLNRNVRGMTRSAIQGFFPGFQSDLRSVTLLPPLARRLGGRVERWYPTLLCLPFLRTHYLGLLIKP